ncbi:MAG: LysR family transcriptional regulator [Anaerolinea sp.]|nr:LysR family transcriptional regulator [Anaerolinea sp.]
MLDAHQLNVFLVAAETLNFTQAASRLHMSQPSVSQHILSLEQHFEQPLFIRSGRNIQLTDAGTALMPLAKELVNRSVQIEEVMKSLEGEVHGHLMIGCSTTPGKYILPQLLARFHRLYPKVTLSCQVASQQVSFEMVCTGHAHFALLSKPNATCKGVELQEFMDDEILLIAPLTHPWAQRQEIEPEELYTATFILREEDSGTQVAVRSGLSQVGVDIDQLEKLLELGNSEAIAMAVQEGLGLGFVSKVVVERLVKARVAPVSVRGLDLRRKIYISRSVRRPATTAQMAFWDFIINIEGFPMIGVYYDG